MRFGLDSTFVFHLRCALLIGLSAAFVTLFGALLYNAAEVQRFSELQRGFDAETRRLSTRLDSQVSKLQEADRVSSFDVQQRLLAISARQDATDDATAFVGARAPFDIDGKIGAIVELVCIDNVDREIYYTGSGTVVDASGMVLTNRHILLSEDGSLITHCGIGFTSDIQSPPKIEYIGRAAAVQEANDLALLRIVERIDGKALPKAFPIVSLAGAKSASDSLGIGDPVFIGGYPGIGADTFTFTQGVVSGRVGAELIKTSALIDSGTSGGAVFDARGRFVGVPTAAVRGDIGGSLGYLIGANVVEEFVTAYVNSLAR